MILDSSLPKPYCYKGGAKIGRHQWPFYSCSSPGLELARLIIAPNFIELEVSWLIKLRKYRIERCQITHVIFSRGLFFGSVLFEHCNPELSPCIDFWCREKDWDALKRELAAANFTE